MIYCLNVLMTLALGFVFGALLVMLGIILCVAVDYRPKTGCGGRGP